jgi:hypothetical protein
MKLSILYKLRGLLKTVGDLLANTFKRRVLVEGGTYQNHVCVVDELNSLNNINVLDDTTLVMIPSGTKAGKIFSVVPKEVIDNTELITNGDFNTDINGWTNGNGFSWEAGEAKKIAGSSHDYLTQNILTVGKTYIFTIDVRGTGSNSFIQIYSGGSHFLYNTDGTYTNTFVATDDKFKVRGVANSTSLFIDNVSVKEVTTPSRDLGFSRSTTATRVNESGLIETVAINTPRIDFTGGGCGKYLFEPQRTNTITSNSDYSNRWQNAGANPITNDAIQSPKDGVLAQKITVANSYGQHYFRQIINGHTIGKDYTFSVFAKAGELDSLTLRLLNGTNGNVTFDLTNGVISSSGTNGKIEDYGNGWYRCIAYFVAQSTLLYPYLYALMGNTQGDGTSGMYWWNAQLEEGSYATSAIETAGSTVTRTADSSSITGLSSFINSVEGVFMVEMAALANDGPIRIISLSDGTISNTIDIRYTSLSNQIYARVKVGGTNSALFTYSATDVTDIHKVAIRYKENDFSFWINGVEQSTDTSGTVFAANTLTTFSFDYAGDLLFYGRINQLVLADYLTDTQMSALTTL